MGLILEYEGKEYLYKKYNIPMVKYKLVTNRQEAEEAIDSLTPPVAVKAQILSGGRGKLGLVKFSLTKQAALENYDDISSKEFEGKKINHILIEAGADIKRELFISMVFNTKNEIVVLFSAEGGIDIETLAEKSPEKIEQFTISINDEVFSHLFIAGIANQGIKGKIKLKIANIIATLVKMMLNEDLILVEINPLVITSSDDVLALDARIGIDDDATFRHPERKTWLSQKLRYTKDERDAEDNGLAYVDLGGEIGMLSCGAGMGMATADLIEYFGGTPRNFLDVGGGASQEKVENALRIMINSGKIKSILINAFGGITRLDDVANGIIEAKSKYDITVPIVIRLNGTNQDEGFAILKNSGLDAYLDMEPAIQKAVELAQEVN